MPARRAGDRAAGARPRVHPGGFVPHARAARDLRELGAHREVPRLPRRLAQALPGGRLYRRLLLDDHPVTPYAGFIMPAFMASRRSRPGGVAMLRTRAEDVSR